MNNLQLNPSTEQSAENNPLHTQLSSYGLRPKDWVLSKESSSHYRITNRSDSSFVFRGKITFYKGQKKWLHIQLLSL